jgi:transmembrane sensor
MNKDVLSPGSTEDAHLWAIRVQESSFSDWDALTAWLKADPANLVAYEEVLAQEDWLDQVFASRLAEPDVQQAARGRRWHGWGAGIAAAAVALASWSMIDRGGAMQEITTPPGQHRTIALADGSRIVLNGGARISFASDKPREIALAQGEVLFDIRHDARDPFIVTAGDTRLIDAGTVFNVVREEGAIAVAVAEGEVIYRPGNEEIRLHPGDVLSRDDAGAKPVVRKVSPQAIGSWRSGRLDYQDASLAEVARDLGRNIGRPVLAAEGLRSTRFTGTLAVDGNAQDVLSRAGPLLGVNFVADGETWRMTPANAALP